ncbi:zinc-dependent alcohol dehydrogenase family protein [Flagellimonas sp. S174]|uniref:zinc-dependent alcohol dehydrogenase family protein n=1 Tax=Flagellimonas sp. S174 TaxID=3410790 RepID=UPI003BF487D0
MKAILFEQFQGPLRLENVPDPIAKDEGVVIKVTATGLCRSDWHGWMGHDPDIVLPHVPGHELAGIVEITGKNVKKFKAGDRVTLPFVCGCGHCPQCASGNHQICDRQSQPGFTHWGSFAEYVAIDYADVNLVKLPETIEDTTAAALGYRFITAFRAVVAQGKTREGQFVAVHGCGGVGQSAIMIAKALGAQVIAIDIHEPSLRLAKELGASFVVNASKSHDVVAEVVSLSNGGVHVSLDALGSAVTCFNSITNLRKQGKHIQVGLMTGNHQHPKVPMDKILADELEILGSHGMQAHKYPEMLQMIQKGVLQPQKLIERTIKLEELVTELPRMDTFSTSGIMVVDRF